MMPPVIQKPALLFDSPSHRPLQHRTSSVIPPTPRRFQENLEPGINLLPRGVRGKRHPGLAGHPALL
jgi:hypothetical protein